MGDWTNKGTPAIGVHRTASHYSEKRLDRPRYQHWNGRHWGQIGLTVDEAIAFADVKTQYTPSTWRTV